MQPNNPTTSLANSPAFPAAWRWLMDEAVPQWVKEKYSPKDSWKKNPFGKADATFFFKGIEELSELFTSDRSRSMPPYFQHPKYRSSYLLYFFPLQAAKFLTLLRVHVAACQAALEHAKKAGVLRLADLGAGPGTATFSFLLWYLDQLKSDPTLEGLPIEIDWLDTDKAILKDGAALLELFSSHFPRIRDKIILRVHTEPWWKAPSLLKNETSLLFLGHVLNESRKRDMEGIVTPLQKLLNGPAQGGGILVIEPAIRSSAQLLSQIRDQLLTGAEIPAGKSPLWGPCLHSGNCPMASGRDWCHFSVPLEIPGQWFKMFSKGLGSERQWVKFSYLWLAAPSSLAPAAPRRLRRVISDPIREPSKQARTATVLICEPDRVQRKTVSAKTRIHRGDLIEAPTTDRSGWLPFGSQRRRW